MRIDIPEILEELNDKYCRNCCGEGYIIYVGSPGYFDMHEGQWYPSETTEPCDDCQGTGDYYYPPGRLGNIYQLLDELTITEREALNHIYEIEIGEATLAGSTYQALWKLLENIELETEPDDPATIELHALLAGSTVIPDDPTPQPDAQPITAQDSR